MQYEEFEVAGGEKLNEVMQGGDFDDFSQLEDALIEIRKIQAEAEHVKELKRRRTAIYNDHIKQLEEKESILRGAIDRCMSSSGKKSLKYPGVGSISKRKRKGTWTILDEDALVEHCRSLGVGEEAISQIVKIDKTKMNKVLDSLLQNNNIPNSVAEKSEDSESLSISVEKAEVEQTEVAPQPKKMIKQGSDSAGEDFDSLTI